MPCSASGTLSIATTALLAPQPAHHHPLIWQTPGHFHPLGFQLEWSIWMKLWSQVIYSDYSSINFTLSSCPWLAPPIPFSPRNHLSLLQPVLDVGGGHIAFLEPFSPLQARIRDRFWRRAPNSFVSEPFLASPSAYALPTFPFSGTSDGGIG